MQERVRGGVRRREVGPPAPTAFAPISTARGPTRHAAAAVNKSLRTSGQPLDAATQGAMQSCFGHSFSEVRVHTDSSAAHAADAVDAAAFTVGNHLVFRDGISLRSRGGALVLAHELAHVAQRDLAGTSFEPAELTVSSRRDPSEREADAAARMVMLGGPVSVRERPGSVLSCSQEDDMRQWMSDVGAGISQEGLSSLLDPFGAADRQAAQRELADRFDVVGDDFEGTRLPNQVTQEEYEKIAGTYSDIRLGRGDLTIDPSKLKTPEEQEAYRKGAMDDIAAMMQTSSGRAEIEQLHDNAPQEDREGNPIHRHTTLEPLFKEKSDELNLRNARSVPDDIPASLQTVKEDETLGAPGAGSDVHIQFNPGANPGDADPKAAELNPWLAQMRSDVLLAHEMNHAIHETAGTGDPRQVHAGDNPENAGDPAMRRDANYRSDEGRALTEIEHQAVGVGPYADDQMTENDYRAERRIMGETDATGTLPGDETMGLREGYAERKDWEGPPPDTGEDLPIVAPPDVLDDQVAAE